MQETSPQYTKIRQHVADLLHENLFTNQSGIETVRASTAVAAYIMSLLPPPSEAEGQGMIIAAQDEYIALLVKEIDSMVSIAYTHGWRSDNHEAGAKLRERIAALKSHPAPSGPVEADFDTALEAEINKLPYTKHVDDGQYNDGQLAGFERGAEWARKYLANPMPVDGPWKYGCMVSPPPPESGCVNTVTQWITDGKTRIEIDDFDADVIENGEVSLASFLNKYGYKLSIDDPSPLLISHLEEQIAHLKSQQAGPRLDADELWDEYSEHVDDDIDSLQNVAGCSVITRRQFNKLIAKISDSPAPEQVDPELIATYKEYVQLLTDECSELVGMAAVHGWRSTRYEKGVELREKIEALQTK